MTRQELDSAAAALLMRTLLGATVEGDEIEHVGWERLATIALRNGVLLRTAACLERPGLAAPTAVTRMIAEERLRAGGAVDIVRRVSEICTRAGVEFLFPKALQHLPDVGSDLDLLVGTSSTAIDDLLARELGGTLTGRNLVSRMAGTSTYSIPGRPPLDIQHGRMGAVGEHSDFPKALLSGRRPRVVDGTRFLVPSADDQVVLQGMQRVYGRRRIRLSDLVYTIRTITDDRLDWDYIVAQARAAGIIGGLGCYLSYADQIHREVAGRALLDADVRTRLPLTGWGSLAFRGGFYRYPVVRVSARIYPRNFGAQLLHGNWTGAGRLCLVPFLGVASALRARAAASVTATA